MNQQIGQPDWYGLQRRRTILLTLGVLALALIFARAASANLTVSDFSAISSNTQAGAHPDLVAGFELDEPEEREVAKDVEVELPAGVFGNPGAIYKCRALEFAFNTCGVGTQAGLVKVIANYEGNPTFVLGTAPLYNMVPLADETARFAFVAPTINVPVTIRVTVRSATDYGVTLGVTGIPQQIPLRSVEMIVWGFPAAHLHKPERFRPGAPGEPPGCSGTLTTNCIAAPFADSGLNVKPFIDNPSRCTGEPLPTTLRVTTYQSPGVPVEATDDYPATTGCEKQKFDPVFNLGLTGNEADSASGLDVMLKATQFLEGEAPSQSQLRSAQLRLPPGLTINPDAADGQTSCSDAEAAISAPRTPADALTTQRSGPWKSTHRRSTAR